MPDLKLTLPERSLLLILMAENAELSNPAIKTQFSAGLQLTGKSRVKLVDAKLIECRKGERGAYFFTLGDAGWAWCRDELTSTEIPAGNTPGQALYSILHGLDRYLAGTAHSLADIFGGQPATDHPRTPQPPATAEPVPADVIELLVRRAYKKIADPAGSWIGLADLRDHLTEIPRSDLDGVLRLMARIPGVRIEEETNQKALTARDRDAAIKIGPRDEHVLAIESL
jgi:hypothetical protein